MSEKMDLATAVAVLNREKHRGRQDWRLGGAYRPGCELVIVSGNACNCEYRFWPEEAIAIATAYEQDRLAREHGGLEEKIRSILAEEAERVRREGIPGQAEREAKATEIIRGSFAEFKRNALIQELEALGNSTLGLDVAIEQRLAELRSQDGA